jgi:hypothetical protein
VDHRLLVREVLTGSSDVACAFAWVAAAVAFADGRSACIA